MKRGEQERIKQTLEQEELKSKTLEDAEALANEWDSLSLIERDVGLSTIISRALNLDERQIEVLRKFLAAKGICTVKAFNKDLREARISRDGKLQERTKPTPEEVSREKRECEEKSAKLILCEDLLSEMIKTVRALGLAGEERNAKILCLGLTSRLLDRPVNVVVKGPSSGGKSFLSEVVLKLFPSSAFYALTSLSERAIAYSNEPLAHRHLVLFEAAGLRRGFGEYLIRSLVSEGKSGMRRLKAHKTA